MTVALVTGASRGLGRAIALQLARDGMELALNDIEAQRAQLQSVKAEIEQLGKKATIYIADVSTEEEVIEMVQNTVAEFGELNVMVANAGIVVVKSILEISMAEWDRCQDINVKGVLLCYREAAKQMIKQEKGGKIVGACSTAGFRPSGNTVAYSTSKWAVRGLTQAAALEFAPYDINGTFVFLSYLNSRRYLLTLGESDAPGPVDTNMWQEIDAELGQKYGLDPGTAFQKSIEARSPLKRASTPADIANLVSFLVSDKARNLTGQTVLCDAGINFH